MIKETVIWVLLGIGIMIFTEYSPLKHWQWWTIVISSAFLISWWMEKRSP